MFYFKKIASVASSVLMIGATVALAAAANYPSPFVQGGSADVAVVYGSAAASSDLVATIDINSNLASALSSQTGTTSTTTTSSGGDSVNLATSSRKLYYGDSINAGRTSLSSSELPNVLADGNFQDLAGTQYKYTQTINVGSTAATFGNSGGDLKDPALYLDAGTSTSAPVYNYTLSFNKNLNVSDSTNVQGQKINILGLDYVIGSSSTNSTLYLYGAGQNVVMNGGDAPKTITIGSATHTIELVSTSSATSAKIIFDGISKTVSKGSSYAFAGDVNIYVKDITHPAFQGDIRNIELIIGANTLQLSNGASVKVGADATSVTGTYATVSAAGVGQISGFNVGVAMNRSQTDHIGIGGSWTDPVFKGFKIQFAAATPILNDSSRGMVKIRTDNNQFAYVTFNSARSGATGSKEITYVYDNNTASTAVAPLLAHQTISTNNKGRIIDLEGSNALQNDWIVVNQGDSGSILEVTDLSVDTATSGKATFQDAITGESQTITLTNDSTAYSKSGVNFFGGNGYTIRMNQAGSAVNITWNSGATAIFPRIKLKDGGWLAFLQATNISTNATSLIFPDGQTTLATTGDGGRATNATASTLLNGINWTIEGTGVTATTGTISGISNVAGAGSNSVNCNFTAAKGPAVLFIEPKKWNDGTYGNFICMPLSTTGSTEISVGDPAINGSGSSFVTLNSDTYTKQLVDQYGSFVQKEDRTNENGVATIWYPGSQMYLDVLFASPSTTVIGGGSSGGVSSLGSVTVKDSDVSQVSSKNMIVVGGSCVNTVAASLLGSTSPLCGADFTSKTTVGAGQFLIQSFTSPFSPSKVAVLVAGYNADDTSNAAKYLTTQQVDTMVGKKYVGSSATSAQLVTMSS